MVIQYLSNILGRAKRTLDAKLIKNLINNICPSITLYSEQELNSLISIFNQKYTKECPYFDLIKIENSYIKFTDKFLKLLSNADFKNYLIDFVTYIIKVNNEKKHFDDKFMINEFYNTDDVCLLSNHLIKEIPQNMSGYRFFNEEKIFPVFVKYHKHLEEHDTLNYKDEFINENTFIWYSKNNRYSTSGDGKNIIDRIMKDKSYKFLLFVRKSNSKYIKEDSDYFYLGECNIISYEDVIEDNIPRIRFIIHLENKVRNDIYNYITSTLTDNENND